MRKKQKQYHSDVSDYEEALLKNPHKHFTISLLTDFFFFLSAKIPALSTISENKLEAFLDGIGVAENVREPMRTMVKRHNDIKSLKQGMRQHIGKSVFDQPDNGLVLFEKTFRQDYFAAVCQNSLT